MVGDDKRRGKGRKWRREVRERIGFLLYRTRFRNLSYLATYVVYVYTHTHS